MKVKYFFSPEFFKKLSLEDKLFFALGGFFSLAFLVEFLKIFWEWYSFEKWTLFFWIVSIFYIGYKLRKISRNGRRFSSGVSLTQIRKIVDFIFLGFFIVYGTLSIAAFFIPISYFTLNISLLLLISIYAIWKKMWGKFGINFPLYTVPEKSFFKMLLMSLGVAYILLSMISEKYILVGNDQIIFILIFLVLIIVIITCIFSRVFQNLLHFFTSWEFLYSLKWNIQISLSLLLFFISSAFILVKVWAFDFLFVKKVEHIAEFIPQSQNRVIEEQEDILEKKFVSEIYSLSSPLSLWQRGESVRLLQEVLQKLGTYSQDISSVFDEYTRETLRTTLIEKCNWPQSTQGIFGPQAKTCLDSLEIEVTNTTIE